MDSLTQQQQEQQLSILLKKPQNALCADCNSKSPCWASLDFGVFVCMNCSGAHRSLGQSVTRIKSTKLDTWKKDWIWHMQLNNKMINEYYEAQKNSLMNKQEFSQNRKPNPNSSLVEIKKFVTDKYVRKLYAQHGEDDPITNLKNGKLPLKASSTHSQGDHNKTKIKQTALTSQKQSSKLVEQEAKVKDLTEYAHNVSNKNLSPLTNKTNQINLIDITEETENKKTNTYNKHLFHSLSTKKDQQNSKLNQFFDPFFTQHNQKHLSASQNKVASFDVFKQITAFPSPQPQALSTQSNLNHIQINNHTSHVNHHSYPHLSSTSISGGQTPPSLYSNVHNFGTGHYGVNLDTENSLKVKKQEVGTIEQITLRISDLKRQSQKKSQLKVASWIDQWK